MESKMISRRRMLEGLGGLLPLSVAAGAMGARPALAAAEAGSGKSGGVVYNVHEFGAVGDGQIKNTAAIQKAIDVATAAGGGTVYVPNGKFVTGTLQLKDNVTLHLAEGCTLIGGIEPSDYPHFPTEARDRQTSQGRGGALSLIIGVKAKNIAVTGRGTINGRGDKFTVRDGAPGRPFGIMLCDCSDVVLEDVYVRDAACWVINLRRCERVVVRGVKVFSHTNYNNDGIDIDSCRDVTVTQSIFDCQDDAICLKSTFAPRSENILVSDCLASSHCNAIKFGTSGVGGFTNVTITNCVVVAPRYSNKLNGEQRGIGGINLELVDGGVMDRVTISNITIDGVTLPLFIRLGDRKRNASGGKGSLRNVSISNIVATGMSPIGSSITGVPGQIVENVSLSDIQFVYEGGGTAADAAKPVQEKEKSYPEGTMFKTLPAWGLYCRHVKGLKLRNVKLQTAAPDARPAVIFDDARDIDIDGLDAQYSPGAAPLLRLIQARGVLLRGCRPNAPEGTFLKLEGNKTADIALLGNDLRQVGTAIAIAPEVDPGAVAQTGNLGVSL